MLFGDNGTLYSPPRIPRTLGEQASTVMVSSPKRDEPGTEPLTGPALISQLKQQGLKRAPFEMVMGSFVQIEPGTEGISQ